MRGFTFKQKRKDPVGHIWDMRRLPEIWYNALAKVVGKCGVTNVNECLKDEQK